MERQRLMHLTTALIKKRLNVSEYVAIMRYLGEMARDSVYKADQHHTLIVPFRFH